MGVKIFLKLMRHPLINKFTLGEIITKNKNSKILKILLDIRPENILLRNRDEKLLVKLSDFGLARKVDQNIGTGK